jgi:hypothetical protein
MAALAAAHRKTIEDGSGVALGFDQGPDFFDFAGFADEERASDDAHEGAAHELFFLPGAEFCDGLVSRIGEQRKIDLVLGLEGGLGFDGIRAHAEDSHAEFVEFLLCVAKLGRFNRSTRGVGLGVEEEKNALAGEIFQRNEGVVVCLETETGRFSANLEHGKLPRVGSLKLIK